VTLLCGCSLFGQCVVSAITWAAGCTNFVTRCTFRAHPSVHFPKAHSRDRVSTLTPLHTRTQTSPATPRSAQHSSPTQTSLLPCGATLLRHVCIHGGTHKHNPKVSEISFVGGTVQVVSPSRLVHPTHPQGQYIQRHNREVSPTFGLFLLVCFPMTKTTGATGDRHPRHTLATLVGRHTPT